MDKYDFKTDEEKNLEQLEKERVLNMNPMDGSGLTPEEEAELTLDKRMEEADQRDADLEAGWTPGV